MWIGYTPALYWNLTHAVFYPLLKGHFPCAELLLITTSNPQNRHNLRPNRSKRSRITDPRETQHTLYIQPGYFYTISVDVQLDEHKKH